MNERLKRNSWTDTKKEIIFSVFFLLLAGFFKKRVSLLRSTVYIVITQKPLKSLSFEKEKRNTAQNLRLWIYVSKMGWCVWEREICLCSPSCFQMKMFHNENGCHYLLDTFILCTTWDFIVWHWSRRRCRIKLIHNFFSLSFSLSGVFRDVIDLESVSWVTLHWPSFKRKRACRPHADACRRTQKVRWKSAQKIPDF